MLARLVVRQGVEMQDMKMNDPKLQDPKMTEQLGLALAWHVNGPSF